MKTTSTTEDASKRHIEGRLKTVTKDKEPAGFSWHTAPARDQYCTPQQTHLQN